MSAYFSHISCFWGYSLKHLSTSILAAIVLAPAPTIAEEARGEAGTLMGIGIPDSGALGIPFPHRFHTIQSGVKHMAVGTNYSLFVMHDGTVWHCGRPAPQLSVHHEPRRKIDGLHDIIQVSAGEIHRIFLQSDGTLWGMGSNYIGELGDGKVEHHTSPHRIDTDVKFISAGPAQTLYIKKDNTLWAMGANTYGQCGVGHTDAVLRPTLVAKDVEKATAGNSLAFFIKKDSTLWVMGNSSEGAAFIPPRGKILLPTQVAENVIDVSTGGGSHYVKKDGSLWAAGHNFYGTLGNGTTDHQQTPVQITTDVHRVSNLGTHTLILKKDASLWSTGNNAKGRLCDGTTTHRTSPVRVAEKVADIALGISGHSLFLTQEGVLHGMGHSYLGELGIEIPPTEPRKITDRVLDSFTRNGTTYYINAEGQAFAMGSNPSTPHDTKNPSDTHSGPTLICTEAVQITSSNTHTLIVKQDGTLWGMGKNTSAQLGTATSSRPQPLTQITTGVSRAAASPRRTYYIKSDRTLWAMGAPFSSPNTNTIPNNLPTQIAEDVVDVSAENDHAAYVKTDGTVWLIGKKGSAPFAPGIQPGSEPLQIGDSAIRVESGYRRVFFLKKDQTLWVVGTHRAPHVIEHQHAQPLLVSPHVVDFSASLLSFCYVRRDGNLWGNGPFADAFSPQNAIRPPTLHLASRVKKASVADQHLLYIVKD